MSAATASPPSATIEKPSVDTREYRHFQIGGKMDVLLISDQETDKASAACDVFIGQLCDSLEGIAHFCEHMLFIGTSKYPTENAYDQYLSTHGGSSNAFTDLEHTCYFFDVQAECLEGALDRFAQCFIGPLFTQSALEREVQAVDSEHAKNIHQDMWRMYQLSKAKISDPRHPYSKFGSGNQKSLPIMNVREKLLEFYQKYYRKSLGLYKLVVLGKESLDDLQAMVERYFNEELTSDFPNDNDHSQTNDNDDNNDHNQQLLQELYPTMTKWQVPQYLQVVPVAQVHAVELQFPMPSMWKHYKSKPTHYLSHLMGHEGSGSLLSLLKKKHYALELFADDNSKACVPWLIFTIRAELTELGLEHINDEVIPIMFAYVKLLQSKGPQEWIQNELQTVADLQFRFLSKRDPMDYTCSIAGGMQQYEPCHYLSGAYKIYDWDPDAVKSCLQALTPDNVLVMVSSPTIQGKTTSTEIWYGTEYERVEIEETVWNRWKTVQHSDYPELQLPQVNDMVATNFDLLQDISPDVPKDEPQCIWQDSAIRLWYKPDNVFSMPKVNLLYNFTSVDMTTAETQVAMDLYAELVQEACNEFTYLASMAGLHCTIGFASNTGLSIQASGYNHKAHVLVERIIDTMCNLETIIIPQVYEQIAYKVEQQYQSFLVAQPYSHAVYGSTLCLEDVAFTVEEKLSALKNLTLPEVMFIAKRYWKHCHLEGLVHGNVTAQHAKDISGRILEKLHRSADGRCKPMARRVVQFQPGMSYLYQFKEFNESNTNSCLHYLLQMGPLELYDNATLAFVHHLIREPAFNQLRTEEQLGYIVHTSVKTSGDNIKGLLVMIQSDSFDPIHMESRVEEFLTKFRQKIVQMTPQDIQTNVDAVVASFLEKNRNLGEESYRYWHVISNQTFAFTRLQKLAELVKDNMTKERVLRFFDKYVAPGSVHRKKMCVQVFCKAHQDKMISQCTTAKDGDENKNDEKNVVVVTDPFDFKRTMPFYPLPKKVHVPVVDVPSSVTTVD